MKRAAALSALRQLRDSRTSLRHGTGGITSRSIHGHRSLASLSSDMSSFSSRSRPNKGDTSRTHISNYHLPDVLNTTSRTTAWMPTTQSSVSRRYFQSAKEIRCTTTNASTRNLSTALSADSSQDASFFPSLFIKSDSVTASGAFAEATATYLDPDATNVNDLRDMLTKTKTGIVAHYYMDVELQGILTAAGSDSNGRDMIGIADSLKMGDMAVEMCTPNEQGEGAQQIICLGVDFMAESVQAILHKNGFGHIPVYRADERKIGCSLAESAENDVYRAWLQQHTSGSDQALHVIYINTSLETKAVSSSLVPTITCTSSNVLATLLQASAQMGPDKLKILYGPDTYMGNNLVRFLDVMSTRWDDEKIAHELHPEHNRETLAQLRDQVKVFPSGNCVVHHMFGASVVDTVEQEYDDCFVTAHLEVPGEMFEVAMRKSLTDNGVVGSTSNILHFIQRKVQERISEREQGTPGSDRLRFILGTEAGMVTSIVKSVQQILRESSSGDLDVEIIFPVASEAVTATNDDSLQLVPGVSGGEGCSTAGGCATCPFMKMNDLDAVMDLLNRIDDTKNDPNNTKTSEQLNRHLPPDRLTGRKIGDQDATDLGSEAILYMRDFMKHKRISDELCDKITRAATS